MTSLLNPYITFDGTARQAMEFYHSVFGGELTISTFGELGGSDEPADKDLIMHAQLVAGDLNLMGADTPGHMDYSPGNDFSVSLSGAQSDDATLRGYWDKLAEGGAIEQPLVLAPWGDAFGMLKDKFGIRWLVNISAN